MHTQHHARAAGERVPSTSTSTFNLRLKQPNFWNTPSPATEEKLLARWKAMQLADLLKEARHGAKAFWLLDGPPYANGDAHLGHLLNKTLKDVNARFQHAMGKRVVWRAGWDCHGLPLELAVEKRHGSGAKDDPAGFVSACRAEAAEWKQVQADGMQRLGLLADFESPWLTMDPEREATALLLLKELWEAGLLVERHSPVHWCPACQSALAASELEKTDKERTEVFFLAKLHDDARARLAQRLGRPCDDLHLMSWTTTPWTLWANAAFAHPAQGKVAFLHLASGATVMMALPARDAFVREHGDLVASTASHGPELDGALRFEDFPALQLHAVSPLSERSVPLLPAGFVSAEEGSGFVHVAPAFGPDDFELHEAVGLHLECHVAANGRLATTDAAQPLPAALEGLTLESASEASCTLLRDAGLLVHSERNLVETQMCWRHKKPTFYRASRQWALDLHTPFAGCPEGLAARARQSLDATRFVPDERAKAPLLNMLATRRYWTLSRDRLWGLPLPFFRSRATDALHPDTGALWQALAAQVRQRGVEAWQDMATPEGYVKSTQTVDVWFDSGAAWLSASEEGLHQSDVGVEGRDQTRGWFLSSFLLHAFKSADPAFKALMTHSFLVGEDGLKYSKSAGAGGGANAMTPDAVFAREGADGFRLWVCAQNVGDEVRVSTAAMKQASCDLKDWRSFLRFLLANMAQAPVSVPCVALTPMDRVALRKAAAARDEWAGHMRNGKFNQALQALSAFRLWASTEWFELNKRMLYCARDEDLALQSMQRALQQVFVLFCRMLAPVLPFAAEEAYLAWSGHADASVFVGVVPDWHVDEDADMERVQRALAWRRALMPLVEKARDAVPRGEPVSLGFGGSAPFGFDERSLREWFPNMYAMPDGTTAHFESAIVGADLNVVVGRAASAYRPVRCARCRGYFSAGFGAAGVCRQCEAETAPG